MDNIPPHRPTRQQELERLSLQFNISQVSTTLAAIITVAVALSMNDGRFMDMENRVGPMVEQVMKKNPKQDRATLEFEIRKESRDVENLFRLLCLGWTGLSTGMMEMHRRRYNNTLANGPS